MKAPQEQRYECVKATIKAQNPPDYMRDVSLSDLCAYYFNWHTGEASAPVEVIMKWYKEEKGWQVQEV